MLNSEIVSAELKFRFCKHCQKRVPKESDSDFCCLGCSAVFSILQERGLNSFYQFRNKTQVSPGEFSAPDPNFAREFFYLDDPDFVRDYASEDGSVMRFYLEGVHCAACVWLTEKLPEFISGVSSVRLNLATGVARVKILPGGSFFAAAQEFVKIGYRPHPVKSDEASVLRVKENRIHLKRIGVAAMATGNIMLLAAALYAGADGNYALWFRWASFILMIPVLSYSAIPFYQSAYYAVKKSKISIDVPIVFGLLVGTAASVANLITGAEHIYFDSLSAIVFLLLSTRYLLRKANQSACSASELMQFLAPSRARRFNVKSGSFEDVNSQALQEGDLVRVLPSENFPVDGIVESGTSAVQSALLTGESHSIQAKVGSTVSAGTLNQQAPLDVRVLASGTATRLGKILKSVEEGLSQKSEIESTLDRVGQVFVVAVLSLTVLGFWIGSLYGWHEAINRALAVAIIVCPCTFAFATPLAFSLALSRCARNGILVKSSEIIERLTQVKTIFLDKTGTLTLGDYQIVDWKPLNTEALSILLAMESRSAHPIAKAIMRAFFRQRSTLNLPEVEAFTEVPGVGLKGIIRGMSVEVKAMPAKLSQSHHTELAVFRDEEIIATIELADQLRPDSRTAVNLLRGLGLKLKLLSGDAQGPVQEVAKTLNIASEDSNFGVTPEAKGKILGNTSEAMMIGDGANDAIALSHAHVGVAVQGGMEVSLRAAGVYCSKPGLLPIESLILTARETMRVVHRNLIFAVIYNLIGIGFALTGNLSPLFAAILMPASAATLFVSTLIGTSKLRQTFKIKREIDDGISERGYA